MFLYLVLTILMAEPVPTNLRFDFQQDAVGGLPSGWSARGKAAPETYRVQADPDGNRYLAAHSRGSDVQLGVKLPVEAQHSTVLSWRWRVWELPAGGDESRLAMLDSAAAVYVVFGDGLFPKVLKYVWSSSQPVGSVLRHPRSRRMAMVVLASGLHDPGHWQGVSRGVADDYRKIFGEHPPPITAIGVKTDSDSTRSSARADYDDLNLSVPGVSPKPQGGL